MKMLFPPFLFGRNWKVAVPKEFSEEFFGSFSGVFEEFLRIFGGFFGEFIRDFLGEFLRKNPLHMLITFLNCKKIAINAR